MKTMNQSKLASMPFDKIERACLLHAERAIEAHEAGDQRKYDLHCNLLNQCAMVGRRHLHGPAVEPPRRTAQEAIVAITSLYD